MKLDHLLKFTKVCLVRVVVATMFPGCREAIKLTTYLIGKGQLEKLAFEGMSLFQVG